jgi:sugar fermentation stimulation protein A
MLVRVPLTAAGPLVEAVFISRPNQLIVEARTSSRLVRAHVDDRGHLNDLIVPGVRLLIAPRDELGRKTAFQVVGVYRGDELVSLDVQLPNRLITAALSMSALPQFARYSKVQRDVTVGAHRFDFRLGEGLSSCVLEVKLASVVVRGVARFPAAPSELALANLELLTGMARNGQRCAVLFVIQRPGARAFVPDDQADPAFARALRGAIASGVEVYANLCPVGPEGITLGPGVPVFTALDAIPAELL